jgi:hypothetical protein
MNKKLSELTEKVTSLSADDLLYVSVSGVSKAIKASTVEAPLKAYADQKKSELITEIEALQEDLQQEILGRVDSVGNALNVAKAYTDLKISEETANREFSEQSILSSAYSYVDNILTPIYEAIDFAKNENKEELEAYVDTSIVDSLVEAKTYTDTSVEAKLVQAKSYTDTSVASNLVEAKAYSDTSTASKLVEAKTYTDTSVTTKLVEAKAYTDTSVTAKLVEAKAYSDTSAAGSLVEAKAYVDAKVLEIVPSGSSNIPVGAIQMYAGTSAPSGWLMCDGSAVSRTTYSALFGVVGTSYGTGNGSTTFNLPNPDSNVNIRMIIKI